MEFVTGFLWGAGLSLGLCVGLVAWVFLRTAVYRLLGITGESEKHWEWNRTSVQLLHERNKLTHETNALLEDTVRELGNIAEALRNHV